MEEKRNKYNTDPLDPEFERRTSQLIGATSDVMRATNEPLPREDNLEAETRRFDENSAPFQTNVTNGQQANSYPPYTTAMPPQNSPFTPRASAPPTAPAYLPPQFNPAQFNSPTRKIAKLGLPENFACMLPYVPFYIGIVAALIELAVVSRQEVRTRFHAAQGLSLQLAIFAISFLFRLIGLVTGYHIGGILFSIAAFIFLIISMVRVYKGEPHYLAPLADLTKWLNEKIEPKSQT